MIIADDLTGAADACVAFVMRGLSGAVMFEASKTGEASASPSLASDVIAVSTDSRGLAPALAAEQVGAAVRAAFVPDGFLFKKIDSTLRGPVGAEIEAAMAAAGARVAIVAPAFPAMGRIVERGLLKTTGRGAMPDIDVVQRLREDGVEGCVSVRPTELASAQGRVLVCDSVDQTDLDAIVAAAADGGLAEPILWAGAAGLAHALAAHVTGTETGPAHGPERTVGMGRRRGDVRTMSIVFAIGSTHPVTAAQQQRLLRDAMPIASAHVDDTLAIEHALAMRLDIVVTLPHDAADAPVARFAELLLAREQTAPASCALVMSGGDTAARLCRALGAERIDLGGEVAPGIPWGMLSAVAPRRGPVLSAGRSEVRWPLVLKAGGFGDDDGLVRVRRFLMEQHERQQ